MLHNLDFHHNLYATACKLLLKPYIHVFLNLNKHLDIAYKEETYV